VIVLVLDCAAPACTVCLRHDAAVVAMATKPMARGQDSRLLPMVNDAMKQASLSFSDIDRVVALKGPGSFTGLRIGLAAALGLGLATARPVLGVDRFSIHAAQHPTKKERLWIVLESGRQELFVRAGGSEIPTMMTPDAVVSALAEKIHDEPCVAGDAFALLHAVGMPENLRLDQTEAEAVTAARLASCADLRDGAFAPRPFYLRPPDVTCKTSPRAD